MIILEQAHEIAVSLGKSENMRTTASVKFAEMVKYVYTPGTDGAQQVIDAGQEPTQLGCWKLVTADKSYPKELGTSWSTCKRQLRIGNAPDPIQADKEERNRRAAEYEDRCYNMAPSGSQSVTEEDWCPTHGRKMNGVCPDCDFVGTVEPYKEPPTPPKSWAESEMDRIKAAPSDQDLREFDALYMPYRKVMGAGEKKEPPKPRPAPADHRVAKAIEFFFEGVPVNKRLWVQQRMEEQETALKGEGPHIEWIKAYWASDPEVQSAIKEGIKLENTKRMEG